MNKIINSEIVIGYSQCPRKAFLLYCTNERGTPNEYVEIIRKQQADHKDQYLDMLKQNNNELQPYSDGNLKSGKNILINATLHANCLEVKCDILEKVKTPSDLGRFSYEPTMFTGTHTTNKEQKLELYFVSRVLEQIQGKMPASGTIIDLNNESQKFKIGTNTKALTPILSPLQEWSRSTSPEPPPIILNKHCAYCQFQGLCKIEAERTHNLSLLKGVTRKIMRKYEKKGVFTVQQLSYLFRPRRHRKRIKKSAIHSLELQALAIRTQKIYLEELPEMLRQPVELFLDIEGVPDQDIYYLIGLLLCDSGKCKDYFFWADNMQEESKIWQQLLEEINKYPGAPIYHYGSYELKAIDKLGKRYKTDVENLKKRLININVHIYSKVYFPVNSNSLKEIGNFIGASWTSPHASGLQSLVWRHYWNTTRDLKYKQILLTYNKEDCQALRLLTDELSKIKEKAESLSYIDFAHNPKQHATENATQLHNQFECILKFAHENYNKNKITLLHDENKKPIDKKIGAPKGHQGYTKIIPQSKIFIHIPRRRKCPKHKGELLEISKELTKRTIIDLVFGKTGVRKKTTTFVGEKSYCRRCCHYYIPRGISKLGNDLYGHSFRAWVIYQRLFLRLPYSVIIQVTEDMFNEKMNAATVVNFVRDFASYYSGAEAILTQRILESPFVHVDETKLNIRGNNQYVWVFTNGKHVIFKLTETREANIVHEILSNYQGVLVSDFYGGYDAVNCKQQKCWVHLIRDLNDDLWEAPFDNEFEVFVSEVRNLMVPIFQAIERHGFKKRHLNRFQNTVGRFYENSISLKIYTSELALKYQKRFLRYKENLFTFLEMDGIPWNNNMAERAIRHLAVQRKISLSFYESVAPMYLLLLGIMQTCRFQKKSLLKFFLSREKDIDRFKKSKPIRSSQAVTKMNFDTAPKPSNESNVSKATDSKAPSQLQDSPLGITNDLEL